LMIIKAFILVSGRVRELIYSDTLKKDWFKISN
jgi:hypothetical protein